MKQAKAAIAVTALFLAATLSGSARVVTDFGPCDGGGTWLVVTTLDDKGRVTMVQGTDCDGRNWTSHCSVFALPTDPNQPSAYYHEGTTGEWVRYNVNERGLVSSIWGRDTDGRYWTTEPMQVLFA